MIAPPPFGLHADVPAREYHSWDALSNSTLSILNDHSPAHVAHARTTEGEATEARVLGDALHLCILQPELFPQKYSVVPPCDKRTKEGKAIYATWKAENEGKAELRAPAYEKCLGMSKSVWAHPDARRLLEAPGRTELSGVFRDPRTGLTCKFRVDRSTAFGTPTVVDLKTTESASPARFAKSVYRYGYYRQAPWYLDGLDALGDPHDQFFFIAIEKKPPYAVAVYALDDAAMALGREHLRRLTDVYKQCQDRGEWSAYGQEVRPLSLPSYAWEGSGEDEAHDDAPPIGGYEFGAECSDAGADADDAG